MQAIVHQTMTFQSLILKLSEFWASRGCALQQPLDVEVGAGTMHPETFLRVLGPAHWNVAYVQPSRRPADGRFGENPNRLFKHHQFQVILKPAPDEVQQLYLDSLEACGINPRQHDIRFEEDNWESPTLGAWGIGWQVMFDGMEISQFTYFQQAGGIELAPISAELTYGLERIAMVAAARRQRLRPRVGAGREVRATSGCARKSSSRSTCSARSRCRGAEFGAFHRDLFERYYQFAEALLKAGLIWPALEHCLKCSHLFNILDSSNSIGVTERTAYILRVRQLAIGIAKAYVERRRAAAEPPRRRRRALDGSRAAARNRLRGAAASWLPGLTNQIGEVVVAQLRAHRLPPEAPAETYSTPRRLTVRIVAHSRAADRSRGAGERAAGVGRASSRTARRRRRPPASPRSRASTSSALERRADAEGRVPRVPQAPARQGGRRRAAGRAARHAARPAVPEVDALGRDARRRQGRAAVRPPDPLDALSLRRPRRAVHDRAHAGGADRRRCRTSRPAPSPTATAS